VLDYQGFSQYTKTRNIKLLKWDVKFFFRKCLIFKDFPKGCEILGVLLSSSIFSFFIKEAKYIEEEYAFYNTRLKFKGVDLPKYSFFRNFLISNFTV